MIWGSFDLCNFRGHSGCTSKCCFLYTYDCFQPQNFTAVPYDPLYRSCLSKVRNLKFTKYETDLKYNIVDWKTKHSNVLEMAYHIVKWSEVEHIRSTFKLAVFKVTLGSFGALANLRKKTFKTLPFLHL